MNRLDVAIKAIKQAGIVVKEGFEKVDVSINTKSNSNDILTEYDIKSQEIIISHIKNHFPKDEIIGEEKEYSQNTSSTAWVIDPIDGTNPFSRKMTTFSIVVGYMINHKAEFCVMFNPVVEELYIVENGKGATLNGKKLHIAKRPMKNQLINIEAFGLLKRKKVQLLLQPYVYNVRSLSCSSYSTMQVIKGETDAFIGSTPNIWDKIHYLFLLEAGAKIATFDGKNFDLRKMNYFACHPDNYEKYLTIFEKIFSLKGK